MTIAIGEDHQALLEVSRRFNRERCTRDHRHRCVGPLPRACPGSVHDDDIGAVHLPQPRPRDVDDPPPAGVELGPGAAGREVTVAGGGEPDPGDPSARPPAFAGETGVPVT